MPWRVIVRWSLDDDIGSSFRNTVLIPLLQSAGLKQRRKKTGTWETSRADEATVAKEFAKLLKELSTAPAKSFVELDHLWIYIDRSVDRSDDPKKSN